MLNFLAGEKAQSKPKSTRSFQQTNLNIGVRVLMVAILNSIKQ